MKRRHFLRMAAAPTVAVLTPFSICANLDEIKKDTNLQRRSRRALENAGSALDKAREVYRDGDGVALDASLAEIVASVELAYQSLVERGRNPRRNAQPYKRGEIKTRELLGRLATFRDEMRYMDRERLDPVVEAVDKIHGSFLRDVMGGGE